MANMEGAGSQFSGEWNQSEIDIGIDKYRYRYRYRYRYLLQGIGSHDYRCWKVQDVKLASSRSRRVHGKWRSKAGGRWYKFRSEFVSRQKADVPAQRQWSREKGFWLTQHFILVGPLVDGMGPQPHWERPSAFLDLPIRMWTSSWNTPPQTPRNV